jgi:hypothetical protein
VLGIFFLKNEPNAKNIDQMAKFCPIWSHRLRGRRVSAQVCLSACCRYQENKLPEEKNAKSKKNKK